MQKGCSANNIDNRKKNRLDYIVKL
jgi:hypothetical protein